MPSHRGQTLFAVLATSMLMITSASAAETAEARSACLVQLQARSLRAPLLEAMSGDGPAFQTLFERTAFLIQSAVGISPSAGPTLTPLVTRIQRNAKTLVAQKDTVLRAIDDLRTIRKAAPELLKAAEDLFTEEIVAESPPARLMASSQMAMLTQRMAKSAGELMSPQGVDPEAVFLLRKDADSFLILARGLRDGNTSLRLRPAKSDATRVNITRLITQFERSNSLQLRVLTNLEGLVAAREAQAQALVDADAVDHAMQDACAPRGG